MKKKEITGWILVILGSVGIINGIVTMINYIAQTRAYQQAGGLPTGLLPPGIGIGFWSLPVLILGLFFALRKKPN